MHQLYELNARAWQHERSVELGRPATFDDLGDDLLDRLVESGFTWLYLLGVWEIGALSRRSSLDDAHLREYLASCLPGYTDEDICGPLMAPSAYRVDACLGGDAALSRLRDRARSCGLSLMLDFVPNHVGLDHRWLTEHPDWFIRGGDDDLRRQPGAWAQLPGGIIAHGRDPFFSPWRGTAQLDFSNPAVQAAVIDAAASIAACCDGLRCDVAMLLLPDVFEATWRRRMEPFWRKCLDAVRSRHPGTLFMAEVYWNREYELQQAGFDLTYDKILYDRLLSGDPASIRAHLRAARDYQAHCVRFVENHEEQRAATRFSHPDHHRGALFITAMVPGMLLCHHGQEDGRTLHCSLPARRRPPESGSSAHRSAYAELLGLLGESARMHGAWQLLEPRDASGDPLIALLWSQPSHASLLVVVNASWQHAHGRVDAGVLAGRDLHAADPLSGGTRVLSAAELERGIVVQLPPWGVQAWRLTPVR